MHAANRRLRLNATLVLALATVSAGWADPVNNARPPKDDDDLRHWLQNMVWHHRFTDREISSATGLSADQVAAAKKRLQVSLANRPKRNPDDPLLVVPYPGGRHPRIAFLDGAVHPQRETKVSVFTPWDDSSYVVLDIPEAIRYQDGLLYLAHTHVPTLWTKLGVDLEKLEWRRRKGDLLVMERVLPNGVAFSTVVAPKADSVRMSMTLTNGSNEKLTNLVVQNCVMLKAAKGFSSLTQKNKVLHSPYAACRNEAGDRWIITAWVPCVRPWANAPCPCLHSDPKFPDCAPGESQTLHGWLSFYEGKDIQGEFQCIDATGWRGTAAPK